MKGKPALRPRWGRRRRGVAANLTEMQAALAIGAVISTPLLGTMVGLQRDFKSATVDSQLQSELDVGLTMVSRTLRQLNTIESMTETSIETTDLAAAPGVTPTRRRIYLQNGVLYRQIGTETPVRVAAPVTQFQLAYFRTLAGARSVTTDPAKVTEVEVTLGLRAPESLDRTGHTLIVLRNRAR